MTTTPELEAAVEERRKAALKHVQAHIETMFTAWCQEQGEEPIEMMQAIMQPDLDGIAQSLALSLTLTNGPV